MTIDILYTCHDKRERPDSLFPSLPSDFVPLAARVIYHRVMKRDTVRTRSDVLDERTETVIMFSISFDTWRFSVKKKKKLSTTIVKL